MNSDDTLFDESHVDKALRLQNGLIAHATGDVFEGEMPRIRSCGLFLRPVLTRRLNFQPLSDGVVISGISGASSKMSWPHTKNDASLFGTSSALSLNILRHMIARPGACLSQQLLKRLTRIMYMPLGRKLLIADEVTQKEQ
jgi:hypothetical protein